MDPSSYGYYQGPTPINMGALQGGYPAQGFAGQGPPFQQAFR